MPHTRAKLAGMTRPTRTSHNVCRVALLTDPVRRDRSPGIDCLRGLFALYVLFGHLLPWAVYVSGTTTVFTHVNTWLTHVFQGHFETDPAVLGFIVLSGYCIHRNGLRADNFNIRAYATRRAFRIIPVYVLGCALGVVLLAGAGPAAHDLAGTPSISLSGVLTKLTTIGAVIPSRYAPSFQGNAPLVTVAAEMWLYVFYALMVSRPRLLWPTVLVLWLGGILWVSGHPQYLGWWHIGSLPGFLPYWWLGALFVNPDFIGRRPQVLGAAAVSWLVLSVVLDGHTGSLWIIEARKLMLATLIGGAIVLLDGVQHRVLAAGSLIGRAGYSVYALHAPIIIFLLVAGVPWTLCAAIAVAVALVTFVVYERPLTRVGVRLSVGGSLRRRPAVDLARSA
jgi:peptidoglycan/LPS O-acetylase OafA/YrhL